MILLILFSAQVLAEEALSNNPRGKLTETLGNIITAINRGDFQLRITEADKAGIKREGNQFSILKSLRLKAMINLPVLIKEAIVTRVVKGGKPYGFRVVKLNQESIINKLGVVEGDILKRVDNQLITSERDALRIFNEVKEKDIIEVTLDRSGKDVIYKYRFI